MAKRKLKTDYRSEACNQVVTLMSAGFSLTAAAGAIGSSCATMNRWMDEREEFRDAVSRGKAARVFALESKMLASENTAVINACRFALTNAAPEEWREKPAVDPETTQSPLRLLAEQISGNAIRPRLPGTTIVEHEPVVPSATQPPNSEIIDDADDDDRPRIHTVSREIYEDEG